MSQKLKCIMLIDDDESPNFISEKIISKADFTGKCVVMQNAELALDYLEKDDKDHPKPDLIFLDLNMPLMDGWGFLAEYEKFSQDIRDSTVVIIVSTSVNPDDRERAKHNRLVDDFENKILTHGKIENIINKHFLNGIKSKRLMVDTTSKNMDAIE